MQRHIRAIRSPNETKIRNLKVIDKSLELLRISALSHSRQRYKEADVLEFLIILIFELHMLEYCAVSRRSGISTWKQLT